MIITRRIFSSISDKPGKYLVIPPSWISKNGIECDKIGVQPQAFYEQPERCYQPRGSCLGQQPINLLRKTKDENDRLFVEDYVHGKLHFDDIAEQIIVDRRIFPVTAIDSDVSIGGVGEIKLDNNGVINNKSIDHTISLPQNERVLSPNIIQNIHFYTIPYMLF